VFNDPGADDDAREEAAGHLENLKTKAGSALVRDYATSAASAGAMGSIPLSSE
jgi:hypothetical protein